MENARTVEDVLAGRSGLLCLNAIVAKSLAATVASHTRQKTGVDQVLAAFLEPCNQ